MNRFFKAILNYFVKGLLVVLPIGVACFLIVWAIVTVDTAVNVSNILPIDINTHKHVYIPGLGILLVLLILFISGVVVTNIITEPIKHWFNRWLNRLPLFKFLHSSVKDLTEAFVGDEKKFSEAVLVDVNGYGLKKIGFLVQSDLTKLNLPGQVAVYLPSSYSFSGQVVIVAADRVQPIDKSGADMMKFVISGGVSGL